MARHRFIEDQGWKSSLRLAVKIRVIYGDTDQMRVVYHGNYLRYMERARVEFMRKHGVIYAQMEAAGVGLPVVDLALSYRSPARYDDEVSVYVGLERVSWARVHFIYRLCVEPEGREGLSEPLDLLYAETRHGALDLQDLGATRLPDEIYHQLATLQKEQRSENTVE